MEDKYDNLGNFFRKNLMNYDEAEEDWDKPSEGVWEAAQGQLGQLSAQVERKDKKRLWGWAFMLLFLTSTSYISYLHVCMNGLQTEIQSSKLAWSQAIPEAEMLQEEHEEAHACWQKELKDLNQETKFYKENYSKALHAKAGKNVANNSFEHSMPLVLQKNQELTGLQLTTAKKDNYKPLLFVPHPVRLTLFASNQMDPRVAESFNPGKEPEFNQSLNMQKASGPKVEIGYEYGIFNMEFFYIKEFKDLSSTSDELVSDEIRYPAHGLSLGYSLGENFYLRTGIRKASSTSSHQLKQGIIYDDKGEYQNPDGRKGNDLTLSRQTPFSTEENNIKVGFPEGLDLETGDVMAVSLYEKIQFNHFQVPLGLSYFWGKSRLQGELQVGIQWNKMVFRESDFWLAIEAKDKKLDIEKIETINQSLPPLHFWDVYAGLGFNYQLSSRWQARTTLRYTSFFDLRKDESESLLAPTQSLSLGLFYRF